MIESLQNEKIKFLSKILTDNRTRKKEKIFVVEGAQENQSAITAGFTALEFYICQDIYSQEFPHGTVHLISARVYEKLAYRGTTEGILGVYQERNTDLSQFVPGANSKVIIVEGVEKPGNLGAILRSCEAFGIDALIISGAKADFYNPNVIRSSVGCVFSMNIFSATNDEVFDFLQKHQYQIYATFMSHEAVPINRANLSGNAAVIFGTEHSGITDFWLNKSKNILIPMTGKIDSLNISNAVAVTCYEMLRQSK